jgi:hypothetical protein
MHMIKGACTVSVGLQGSCIFFCIISPDPDRLANRRTSPTTIQLYQDYYSASLGYSYVFWAPLTAGDYKS